jgi:hypothetical protein
VSPTDVLGDAWREYGRHWRHLLPIALVVYLLLSLFSLLLVALLGILGAVAAAFVALAGVFWLQGALVVAIEDLRDGRADLSIRETLTRVRPRMNTLGLVGILAALGITIGFIFFIVPGLVLATWWLVVVPVVMLEGRSVFEAFGRSRELVRGNGWNVFGLLVLTLLVLLAAGIVVGIVLAIVLAPLDTSVQRYVSDVISNTLFAPFAALAFTLTYYRLRDREVAAAATAPEPVL